MMKTNEQFEQAVGDFQFALEAMPIFNGFAIDAPEEHQQAWEDALGHLDEAKHILDSILDGLECEEEEDEENTDEDEDDPA